MRNTSSSENLSEYVRTCMETDIRQGALIPGQVLDERSLAERFGVSRTPVREAVLQMSAMGLLKVVPRVGVVVPTLNAKDLVALLEMLAELEGICAKLAAKRMDTSERKFLRDALAECESAANAELPKGYESANDRFHKVIYEASRNEWATEQIRALRMRCIYYQRTRFDLPGRLHQSLEEHRKVVDAIERGDGEAARQAMIEHMAIGGRDFAELVSTMDSSTLTLTSRG